MADANLLDFEKRVGRLASKRGKIAQGYVTSVNHDGLVIARPRRSRARFPVKGLTLTFLALFAMKGFLHANLGASTYNERVGKLAAGTVVEKFGAYAMQADPVTVWVSDQMRSVFR